MKYTVKPTAQFKQDYRRDMRRGLDMEPLDRVIAVLAEGEALPPDLLEKYGLATRAEALREIHFPTGRR